MYLHNSSSSSAKRQLIMDIGPRATRPQIHNGITTRAQLNLSSNEDKLLNRSSYFAGDRTGGCAILGLGLGSLCQSPPSSPLKLNFSYGNRSHDSALLESSVLSSSSSAASTASDGMERPVSFNMQYFMQHIRDKRTDFRKFIPVPFSSLKIPVIPLNEHDSKEYGEAKEAFSDSLPRTSRSDTSVSTGTSPKKTASKRRKFLKMFDCKKSVPNSPQAERDFNYHVSNQLDPMPSKLPKPSDNRFDFATNDAHCKLIAFSKSDQDEFSVSLYVELPKIPNHYLCHVQTELAVAAMKSYFGSLEEQALIELLWVSDIQKQLDHLKTDTKAKFSGIQQNVECIMVVSEKAGILLRHSKLALLHSIAAVLQTNPRKTLILVKNGWWIPTIPELEAETPKEPSFWSALWSRWR